jgi:hypothetical protein
MLAGLLPHDNYTIRYSRLPLVTTYPTHKATLGLAATPICPPVRIKPKATFDPAWKSAWHVCSPC